MRKFGASIWSCWAYKFTFKLRKQFHKFYLILILFSYLPLKVASQTYNIQTQFYGIEQGLSHRDVQCIHKDRLGFMWFGTKFGLNRFDGKSFEWYSKESHGLASNEINVILADRKNRMWLFETGTFFLKKVKSISIFDPVLEKLIPLENIFSANVIFEPENIICFNKDMNGNILLLEKSGRLLNYDGSVWTSIQIDISEFLNVIDVQRDYKNNYWLTVEGLAKIADGNNKIVLSKHDFMGQQKFQHILGTGFAKIFEIKNDYIKLIVSKSDRNEVIKISSQDEIIKEQFIKNELTKNSNWTTIFTPLTIMHKYNNDIWLNNGDNEIKENTFQLFTSRFKVSETIQMALKQIKWVTSIFSVDENHLWVSSQFGVYKLDLIQNHFTKIRPNDLSRRFSIRYITNDGQGNILFKAEAAVPIWKYEPAIGQVSKLNHIFDKLNPKELSAFSILLHKDINGTIYFNSASTIFGFHPQTHELSRWRSVDTSSWKRSLWSIFLSSEEKLWFGSDNGKLGVVEGNTSKYVLDLEPSNSATTYQFFNEKENRVWVATSMGLFYIDLKTQEVIARYCSACPENYVLPFDNIHHVSVDSAGNYWLATSGTGLVKIGFQIDVIGKQKLVVLERYTRINGLSNNTIYAVYPDKFDNLWMSSDHGLMRFNTVSKKVTTFLEEDGIPHNEFNRISHFRDRDGMLYFGGMDGIVSFHPDQFISDSLIENPPLAITQIQLYNSKGILYDHVKALAMENKVIEIKPSDRFFRVEFNLLTYKEIDKNSYAYIIEGVDKNWNYQNENSIRFSRLPYGFHNIRIKGQSSNGLWSDNEILLKVNVLKPFYFQAWFILGIFACILFGIFSFFKIKTHYLKQEIAKATHQIQVDKKTIEAQAEELKKLEKLKSRFFANVSHELRTPLSLIIGPVETLLKGTSTNENALSLLNFIKRNAIHLQKLINEILDLSKLEDSKLEVFEEPVNFYNYLNALLAQFNSFAQSEEMQFDQIYELDKSLQFYIDKNKFEKIIHNYISNAIKFTPVGGKISIITKELESDILIEVKDSGRGIHPMDVPHVFDRFYQSKHANSKGEGGTGIGLALCKELAELLGGKVWLESELGKGSSFYFSFPPKSAAGILLESERDTMEQRFVSNMMVDSQESKICVNRNAKNKILIVEDNADLRNFMTILLEDYNIVTAVHGAIGLEQLKANPDIDLIISDLMMPVMDGYEFINHLKDDDRWRHKPVIMLTAKQNADSKIKAFRIGVDDYLTKPFKEEELKARIENLLILYNERLDLYNKEGLANQNSPVISITDAEWLEKVEEVMTKFLDNSNLKLEYAAELLFISERQLNRRLKKLTGLSPIQYLKEMRLQKAKEYLLDGQFNAIKEVCFAVGYQDVPYFSKLFYERFGSTPSDLL